MKLSALPRPKSFQAEVAAMMTDTTAEELPARVAELHESVVVPLRDQLTTLERETSESHEAARRAHFVMGQVQALATHQITSLAAHGATLAHQAEVLRGIRKLAQAALMGTVKAADILALLETEVISPEFVQVALAFYPSTQYRAGVFASYDDAFKVTYAFVGWTTVAVSAAGGVQVQPTFLVADRGAVPAGVIEAERGLHLQMPLLPNVAAAA